MTGEGTVYSKRKGDLFDYSTLIYLCLPSVYTQSYCLLFLVLEGEGAGQKRREGLFIIWTATFRAELPQGVFLSALLKARFRRDPSPPFKDAHLCANRSLNTASRTLLIPADKDLHALEKQLGTNARVTVNRDIST